MALNAGHSKGWFSLRPLKHMLSVSSCHTFFSKKLQNLCQTWASLMNLSEELRCSGTKPGNLTVLVVHRGALLSQLISWQVRCPR